MAGPSRGARAPRGRRRFAALSLLASVFLSATANGIAVFMVFGAGLAAGLLGQIGEAIGSDTLTRIADVSCWLLPFEALYRAALAALVPDVGGVTGAVIELNLWRVASRRHAADPVRIAYLAAVGMLATWLFGRRDL